MATPVRTLENADAETHRAGSVTPEMATATRPNCSSRWRWPVIDDLARAVGRKDDQVIDAVATPTLRFNLS